MPAPSQPSTAASFIPSDTQGDSPPPLTDGEESAGEDNIPEGPSAPPDDVDDCMMDD